MYLSNVNPITKSPYADVAAAALAEAGDVSPAPTVTSGTLKDSDGNDAVTCTVTYTFNSLCPAYSPSVTMTRTVQMRKN
jgi:hypothetical protein